MVVTPRRRSKLLPIFVPEDAVPEDEPVEERQSTWLLNLMNTARVANQSKMEDPATYVRASASGDPCERSLTIYLLGWREVFEPRRLRIFETGRSIEVSVLNELRGAGLLLGDNEEVVLSEDPPVRGHYDALVKDPTGDERYLGEVKSIKEEYWKKLPEPDNDPEVNGRNLLEKGYVGYVTQWQVYSNALGGLRGFILFESKNTQQRKFYWLSPDPSFMEEVLERLGRAWAYRLLDTVAPRTRNIREDQVCFRCSKRSICGALNAAGASREDLIAADRRLRRE